jgi:hypothetical protein
MIAESEGLCGRRALPPSKHPADEKRQMIAALNRELADVHAHMEGLRALEESGWSSKDKLRWLDLEREERRLVDALRSL